jgi:hypothetical protein
MAASSTMTVMSPSSASVSINQDPGLADDFDREVRWQGDFHL